MYAMYELHVSKQELNQTRDSKDFNHKHNTTQHNTTQQCNNYYTRQDKTTQHNTSNNFSYITLCSNKESKQKRNRLTKTKRVCNTV